MNVVSYPNEYGSYNYYYNYPQSPCTNFFFQAFLPISPQGFQESSYSPALLRALSPNYPVYGYSPLSTASYQPLIAYPTVSPWNIQPSADFQSFPLDWNAFLPQVNSYEGVSPQALNIILIAILVLIALDILFVRPNRASSSNRP